MTGTTIKGYEPAIINTGKGIKFGRVIDIKRMEQAQSTDTELFQTMIPLVDSELNLIELLKDNENGARWLKKLREYSLYYSEEEIPTTLSIRYEKIHSKVEYTLFPEDYCQRERGYFCPRGHLITLPENVIYAIVTPPMVIKDKKRLTNLNWHRKVISSNSIFEGYSLQDVKEENPFKIR